MSTIDGTERKRRDLKGAARRENILALLRSRPRGDISVEELSDSLSVSLATVRRDLARLREQGQIARTYGGGTLLPNAEVPVRERETSFGAAKDAIGAAAAELLSAGDLIIVDAGTTTARFAAHLGGIEDLTVVTNGIGVINSILATPGPEVIVLGGHLRGINETITGDTAQSMLLHLRASRVFLGTDAIDPQRGIASRTLPQALLKNRMMSCATEIIVLADSSKLGDADLDFWSPLTREWTLITDSDADEDALERARRAGATDIRIAHVATANDTSKED